MRAQSVAIFAIAIVPVMAAAQQFATASGPPVDPESRFEVASIRPISDASSPMLIRMTPGGLDSAMPVGVLLRQALQKPDYQMVGAPGWINTERYAIRATASTGASPAAMPVMLRNLLKDRFQLAAHLETREQPIFHLVLARSDGRLGPNLTATSAACQATMANRQEAVKSGKPPAFDPNDPCGSGRTAPGLISGSGRSIAQLVSRLSDLRFEKPTLD
jgi:uncharacterized protein (TIGR03435 family)